MSEQGVAQEPTDPASAAEAGHAEDHGAGGGHEAEHGHDGHGHEGSLGPIDVAAWGAGLIGVGAALVVVVAMAISVGWV